MLLLLQMERAEECHVASPKEDTGPMDAAICRSLVGEIYGMGPFKRLVCFACKKSLPNMLENWSSPPGRTVAAITCVASYNTAEVCKKGRRDFRCPAKAGARASRFHTRRNRTSRMGL